MPQKLVAFLQPHANTWIGCSVKSPMLEKYVERVTFSRVNAVILDAW